MMEKIRNSFKSIASKQGSYSVGLTALVIAIVALINLIVGQLPSQAGQIVINEPSLNYQLFLPVLILSIVTVSFYIVGNSFADAADPKNHVK